tara:strand:+ start:2281 stop:2721 length:441 start_codon:yes stop_codon:yes gene_type:complete
MMIRNYLLIPLLLVSGCSIIPKFGLDDIQPLPPLPPIQIITEQVKLDIFQPPLPQEIRMENVRWYVITEGNLEEKLAEIKQDLGGEFAIMAMTPQGYENMAINMQELRRYILQQKEIILYYREATKSDDGSTAADWLENNEALQSE